MIEDMEIVDISIDVCNKNIEDMVEDMIEEEIVNMSLGLCKQIVEDMVEHMLEDMVEDMVEDMEIANISIDVCTKHTLGHGRDPWLWVYPGEGAAGKSADLP